MAADGHSLSVRAKKGLSSKVSSSKIGRKVIVQLYGDDGEQLFHGIKAAASKFYGADTGEEIEKAVLKFVMKVKILFDENLVNAQNTEELQDPTFKFVFQFLHDLEMSHATQVTAAHSSRALTHVVELASIVFAPHMQKKNIDKFSEMFLKLANADFLNQLLNAAEFTELRAQVYSMLKILSSNVRLRSSHQVSYCMSANCNQIAVRSLGFFRGCGYCVGHHIAYFRPVFESPGLHRFLYDERNAKFFFDFLKDLEYESKDDSALRHYNFLTTASEFANTTAKSGRLRSANLIVKKFFVADAPQSLPLDLKFKEEIINKIASRTEDDARLPTDFFAEAIDLSFAELNKIFSEQFLKSVHFDRFKVTFTVPEKLAEGAVLFNPEDINEREKKINTA
eukprot:TRINITY_DN30458_c0_g1_i1.p1 TRINITY_DN30458_c0_g1~~TRINITY_DN30458_c0_g1_i1.p1  ORF type:complete len:395 (-),score=127.79 TRINITY_DN30458_c0_g1_i1:72-1256(-)